MCLAVKDKLNPHIQPLMNFTCEKNKAHMFFSMLLDPRFLQMKSLLKLHEAENISSYMYFSHMTEYLFDYVVAAEDKKNPPIAAPPTPSSVNYALSDVFGFLLSNTDMESTRVRATQEFGTYKQLVTNHFLSGKPLETASEVLEWFDQNSSKIPMISHFASIIYSIPPSQIENERDFSLAGVTARAKRASFPVKNLSMLVLINKNKDFVQSFTAMNIFEDNFEAIRDELDEVEDFSKENGETEG